MKRIFFRKPILVRINKRWYKEMVENCEKYTKENCKYEDGSWACGKCHFSIKPYCLMHILINEFEK